MSHSLAPWKVVSTRDEFGVPAADRIVDATDEPIAHLGNCIKPTREHEANATAMAAVPDLIAALRDMLFQFADNAQYSDEDAEIIGRAREALFRATGGRDGIEE